MALIVLTVVSGTAIFSALFTAAGGLQFFLVDGSEFTNAFTYGGSYAAQQSQQVFPDPLRIFWTFVVPTAFVAYIPAVAILDLPGDHLAPPLAGVVHAPRRPAGLGHRRPLLEARDPSLPRSRRMSIDSTIIETRDLVREFKKTRAVDRMTFSVAAR